MTISNKLWKSIKFHNTIGYEIFRIVTGIVILYEGFMFVNNHSMLYEIVQNSRIGGLAFILEHHIVFSLIVGGLFIAIGLVTRIAVLFQLPIFIGVIFNQHAAYGLYSVYGNLIFSIIILAALAFVLIGGSGKHSVDGMMRTRKIK